MAAGEFQGLYVASDAIDPWIDEAESNALRSKVEFLVVQDTTVTPLAHLADVVLAGATFAEKAGCYVNADGRLQYSEAALPPRDGSLPDLDLLAILLESAGRAGQVERGPGRAGRDDPGVRGRQGRRAPALRRRAGRTAQAGRRRRCRRASPIPGSSPTGWPGRVRRMYSVGSLPHRRPDK